MKTSIKIFTLLFFIITSFGVAASAFGQQQNIQIKTFTPPTPSPNPNQAAPTPPSNPPANPTPNPGTPNPTTPAQNPPLTQGQTPNSQTSLPSQSWLGNSAASSPNDNSYCNQLAEKYQNKGLIVQDVPGATVAILPAGADSHKLTTDPSNNMVAFEFVGCNNKSPRALIY